MARKKKRKKELVSRKQGEVFTPSRGEQRVL